MVYFYLCTFSDIKTCPTLHLSMAASGQTAAHALKHTNTNCLCANEMSVRFVLVNKWMNLYGKTTFKEIESDFVDSSLVRSSCAVQLLFACRVCRRETIVIATYYYFYFCQAHIEQSSSHCTFVKLTSVHHYLKKKIYTQITL